jgi:predicted transposase/invertase (TIGR01784 family)
LSQLIHQPNDKLFKNSMAEIAVATEFFNAHLPKELLEKIDLDTLKLEKHTFIDEVYKSTEADVVYSVKMGQETAYLYLLCEQQTEVDPWLAYRLLVYTVRIMELHLKQHPHGPLPLVHTMVVYTGDEPWHAPLDIFPLFGDAENLAREMLLKPYQLMDVQRTSDDDLRQNELYGLVAFTLKHRKTEDFRQFLKRFMPWVHKVELQYQSGALLGRFMLKYIIDRSSQGDKDLLVQEAQHYLSEELTGEIMTIAQQWEQEGIRKGIQQGVQQGMQQGEAAILKHQLQRRFGELPLMYRQRIDRADAATLLRWSENILDAKTVNDVFDEPDIH